MVAFGVRNLQNEGGQMTKAALKLGFKNLWFWLFLTTTLLQVFRGSVVDAIIFGSGTLMVFLSAANLLNREYLAAVWRPVDVVLERRDAHEAPAILEKCRHAIFDGLLCVRHDLENAATHLFESRTLWLFYPIEKLIDFGFRHRRSFS